MQRPFPDLESYDRILRSALCEVRPAIERLVERAFADVPLDARELPVIGGWADCTRADQKELAVAALVCRQWCKYELPAWAPELPLKLDDCYALLNPGNERFFSLAGQRSVLVAQYALRARGSRWDLQLIPRFERFCAGENNASYS